MKIPNDPGSPSSRTSLLAWTLLASVVLNLFLVGVLAGIVPGGRHHSSFGPLQLAAPYGDSLGGWVERHLDPPDAAIFQEALQAKMDHLKQSHAHVHQAIKDVATIFEQDPADLPALQAALDRLTQAKTELNTTVGAIIQNVYSKLSPEGRRRLAELAH